jgi:HK97 gp10 family phage protein
MADLDVECKTNEPEFRRYIKKLGADAPKAIDTAVRAAAYVFRNAIKARAPRRTGLLQSKVFTKRTKRTTNTTIDYMVAVYSGSAVKSRSGRGGKAGKGAFYWYFLERGFHPRGGKRLVPARQFVTQAYNANRGAAEAKFNSTLDDEFKKLSNVTLPGPV